MPAIRPNTTDPTKYFSRILVWSSTEIAAAVIALCMPTLKRLFSSLLSDSPLSSDSNSPKHSANSGQPGHRMSVLHRKHRVRVTSGETADISDSEENLWADGTSASADFHGKTNSSVNGLVSFYCKCGLFRISSRCHVFYNRTLSDILSPLKPKPRPCGGDLLVAHHLFQ
jgi:hypothetical protein